MHLRGQEIEDPEYYRQASQMRDDERRRNLSEPLETPCDSWRESGYWP